MSSSAVQRGPSRAGRALLGLVALMLFAAAIGGTWFVLKGGLQRGMLVRAQFSAQEGELRGVIGQQLPEGGDVKVRGVLVGRVSDIDLAEDGTVTVSMQLNESGLDLPASTSAEIGSKTLFGEKWIELVPPETSSAGAVLVQGDVIPDERTAEPLELERQLQLGHDLLSVVPLDDLAVLLESLARGFSDGRSVAGAQDAIDRGLVALKAVNSRSDELDLGLRQLREVAEFLDSSDTDLLAFMRSLDDANRALVGAAPEFSSSLQSVPVFLDDLAAFQERTEADLGRLVENGATVAELVSERVDSLTDIIVQLEAFTTVWNSGLEQPCAGLFEEDMTCWQLYLTPGLESRGLYNKRNPPPNEGEPGDPGNGSVGRSITKKRIGAGLEERLASDLREILWAPARDGGQASRQPR